MEYHAPINEIFESLNMVGVEKIADWDTELAREIAEHFARFASDVLAPLNGSGDKEGCHFENGRVIMPKGIKAAYEQIQADGWQGLSLPENYGGQGMSVIHQAIIAEICSGANHAFQMVVGLVPGAARVLLDFGNQAQIAYYLPKLASGEMLTTMCLTEPSAGSDLSAIRTKAVQGSEHWKITGEKIFISNGDQDLSENILHLVLARTSDEGLKGLSLFAIEGRVNVTRIEEKMGLHASATCQIAFDEHKAELIGEVGQGLAAMFAMMDHARIDVALQGVAHAARAHDLAQSYAAERMQSGVTLDKHADVQRMLNEMDYYAKSARVMTHLALVVLETGENAELVEFLTPLVKFYATEAGMRASELGVQVLGGYGYLHEYGMEQIYRDARITAIYEGANGIHARALATRAFKTGSVEAFDQFLVERNARIAPWISGKSLMQNSDDVLPLAHDWAQLAALTLANALLPNKETEIRAQMHYEMIKAKLL